MTWFFEAAYVLVYWLVMFPSARRHVRRGTVWGSGYVVAGLNWSAALATRAHVRLALDVLIDAAPAWANAGPRSLARDALILLLDNTPAVRDPEVMTAVFMFVPIAGQQEAMGFASTCSSKELQVRLRSWMAPSAPASPTSRPPDRVRRRTVDGQEIH